MTHRTHIIVVALAVTAAAISGCGGSAQMPIAPSSKLVPGPGGSPGRIVLTAQGEQRIGLQTATTQAVTGPSRAARVIVPFSAIVYAPSGATYAFTNPAPLTFTEVPVDVDRISGNLAYLASGPRAGAKVVTVGAEELYGVQTGVLAQT